MAYVSVPKDLTKVKNKVAFNLTKRQLICIGIGAAMGIPSYFLLRNVMGNSNAATVMVLLMLGNKGTVDGAPVHAGASKVSPLPHR